MNNIARVWRLTGGLIHTPEYRRTHLSSLRPFLRNDGRMLDAAAGDFPSLDLLKNGFNNFTFLNGDEGSAQYLEQRIREAGFDAPVICGQWQNLTDVVTGPYGVVAVLDNSLTHLDTWCDDPDFAEGEEVLERTAQVLDQFYRVTDKNGTIVVGFAKSNRYNENGDLVSTVTHADKVTTEDGVEIEMGWVSNLDWVRRIKDTVIEVKVPGEEVQTSNPRAYLYTVEELMGTMQRVGFRDVVLVQTPEILYENLVVGHR